MRHVATQDCAIMDWIAEDMVFASDSSDYPSRPNFITAGYKREKQAQKSIAFFFRCWQRCDNSPQRLIDRFGGFEYGGDIRIKTDINRSCPSWSAKRLGFALV